MIHINARRFWVVSLMSLLSLASFQGYAQTRSYYQLKVYQLKDQAQLDALSGYLQTAYVPALHKAGIAQVGVFRTLESDTAKPRMYVLIPFQSLDDLERLDTALARDKAFQSAGSDYLNAAYNNPPYGRIESIIIHAFPDGPRLVKPSLSAAHADRIYELRSYEGATEKFHARKIRMFNQGGEIGLFKRLVFNGMFYGEVVSGSHMPNLMYMTTFNSMAERDAHWKAFFSDPVWKKLSAQPQYEHNVSKAVIMFLHPTDYSDL